MNKSRAKKKLKELGIEGMDFLMDQIFDEPLISSDSENVEVVDGHYKFKDGEFICCISKGELVLHSGVKNAGVVTDVSGRIVVRDNG